MIKKYWQLLGSRSKELLKRELNKLFKTKTMLFSRYQLKRDSNQDTTQDFHLS